MRSPFGTFTSEDERLNAILESVTRVLEGDKSDIETIEKIEQEIAQYASEAVRNRAFYQMATTYVGGGESEFSKILIKTFDEYVDKETKDMT